MQLYEATKSISETFTIGHYAVHFCYHHVVCQPSKIGIKAFVYKHRLTFHRVPKSIFHTNYIDIRHV